MVRTQIQLSEEQARRVKEQARMEGVPMAEVIRRCIDKALSDEESSRELAYERASGLIGALTDPEGTTDLAERHDDYLDGAW